MDVKLSLYITIHLSIYPPRPSSYSSVSRISLLLTSSQCCPFGDLMEMSSHSLYLWGFHFLALQCDSEIHLYHG